MLLLNLAPLVREISWNNNMTKEGYRYNKCQCGSIGGMIRECANEYRSR